MSGPDGVDAFARADAPTPGLSSVIRVAVPTAEHLQGMADGWIEAFAAVVDRLEATGVEIVEVDIAPLLEAAQLLYGGAFVAERTAAVGDFIAANRDLVGPDIDPTVAAIVLAGADVRAVDYVRDRERLAALGMAGLSRLEDTDALLTPTTTWHPTLAEVAADPIGANSRMGRFTNFANLLDRSALAVPTGAVDGLPFGVMLTGPAFADRALAQLADRISAAPIDILVVGAHLRGQPLNHQLVTVGGSFVAEVQTHDSYLLYALQTTPPKPGLVRIADGGTSILGEVWRLPAAGFGAFVASLPRTNGDRVGAARRWLTRLRLPLRTGVPDRSDRHQSLRGLARLSREQVVTAVTRATPEPLGWHESASLRVAGRPQKLVPLVVGFEAIAEAVSLSGGSGFRYLMEPVTAAAIVFDEGWILVDGGFDPARIRDRAVRTASFDYENYAAIVPTGDPLVDQVAAAGLEWSDLGAAAVSHAHFDHTGATRLLTPDQPVLLQRREWDHVQGVEDARMNFLFREDLVRPGLQPVLLDGDTVLAEGLQAIDTAGHTPGHQSFVVQLPDRTIVLACDAADLRANVVQRRPCGSTVGPDGVRLAQEAIDRLNELDGREGFEVWPAHDPEWEPWQKVIDVVAGPARGSAPRTH